jgi:hypothetical protein
MLAKPQWHWTMTSLKYSRCSTVLKRCIVICSQTTETLTRVTGVSVRLVPVACGVTTVTTVITVSLQLLAMSLRSPAIVSGSVTWRRRGPYIGWISAQAQNYVCYQEDNIKIPLRKPNKNPGAAKKKPVEDVESHVGVCTGVIGRWSVSCPISH